MKKVNRVLTILVFIFLYIPMVVLIVSSFNTGKDITQFDGFTLRQYVRLFQDRSLLKLLGNSLLISVLASFVATAFGTVAALGIHGLNPGQALSVDCYTRPGQLHLVSAEARYVSVSDLGGRPVYAGKVQGNVTLRLPQGVYLLGSRKVVVP